MADNAHDPLVSVVTIFLNAESYLEEAIQSVLAQTYESWELLLVDDGSTDDSASIAVRYETLFPGRIRYLQHPDRGNHGMSASRNRGFTAASGEIFALLDADDVFLPHKLEHQVRLLQRHPKAGWVYGATEYWFSWTGLPEDEGLDRPRRSYLSSQTTPSPPDLFRQFLSGDARTPCTCGVLMRRSAVEAIEGFEEQFRGIDEDQIFFLKLALNSAAYVDGVCCDRYRQRSDSTVQLSRKSGDWRPGRRASPARQRYLTWLEQYLVEQDVRDPDIWRLVQLQKRPLRYPRLYDILATASDLHERVLRRTRSVTRNLFDRNGS